MQVQIISQQLLLHEVTKQCPKTEFNTSFGTSVEKLSSPEDGCSNMSDP